MIAPPMVSFHKAFYIIYLDYVREITEVEEFKLWIYYVDKQFTSFRFGLYFSATMVCIALAIGLNKLKQPLFASLTLGFCLMYFFSKPLAYYYMFLALIPAVFIITNNSHSAARHLILPILLLQLACMILSPGLFEHFNITLSAYEYTAYRSVAILFLLLYLTIILNRPNIIHVEPVKDAHADHQ